MPMTDGIVAVSIVVKLRKDKPPDQLSPGFEIRAGVTDGTPDKLPLVGSGDIFEVAFFREILGKLLASFPRPISLCVSGSRIRPDTQCPAPAGPPAGNCVITVTNRYNDGSQLDGFCTFIYTTALGQIEDVREAKAPSASASSALTFKQPIPGRVGAYRVHVVRKKPNGSEEHFFDGKIAQPGIAIYEDEKYFPPINVNIASRAELEEIRGIGPATSQAIVDARPFTKIDDLKKVVAEVVGAAVSSKLEGKVVLS